MSPTELIGGAAPLREDPLRRSLANEVHARPYEVLRPPMRVSHLAMLTGETSADADRAAIEALCRTGGIAPPRPLDTHFSADFGDFRLRWERHTEFCTYSFYRPGLFEDPFDRPAIRLPPADWLARLPGRLLVAVHAAIDGVFRPAEEMERIFAGHALIGSKVVGDAAEILTDFHIHDDGFGRILILDRGLTPHQSGRLVQRLLEIETYRIMALHAFPAAREIRPQLRRMDDDLAEITRAMAGPAGDAEDRQLLGRLTDLAAEAEHQAAAYSYRFAAARAYYALVVKRIEELRENRIAGMQTIGEFMDRRLGPAMQTVESTALRHANLLNRIQRAGALLRTRVEMALGEKNGGLLNSMNRRAELQLRLQETVEGLSVVAISYYLLGLLGYVAKGLKAEGLHIDPDLTVLAGLPIVIGLVMLGVRRLRRAIGHKAADS